MVEFFLPFTLLVSPQVLIPFRSSDDLILLCNGKTDVNKTQMCFFRHLSLAVSVYSPYIQIRWLSLVLLSCSCLIMEHCPIFICKLKGPSSSYLLSTLHLFSMYHSIYHSSGRILVQKTSYYFPIFLSNLLSYMKTHTQTFIPLKPCSFLKLYIFLLKIRLNCQFFLPSLTSTDSFPSTHSTWTLLAFFQ